MPLANLETLDMNFLDEGEGFPVLLIHGFASNHSVNWKGTGWVKLLVSSGFRVIAPDNRGHGQSTKFHDSKDYSLAIMADDCRRLLEHLKIENCHVLGYSLGARIASVFTHGFPSLVSRLALSGNGYNMIEGGFDSSQIHQGLSAPSMEQVESDIGRQFRTFATQTGSDLEALAACIMGAREHISEDAFKQIIQPTIVSVGTEDTVATNGEKLAETIPNAEFLPIPGRNHMNAVGDKIHKQGVVDFFLA